MSYSPENFKTELEQSFSFLQNWREQRPILNFADSKMSLHSKIEMIAQAIKGEIEEYREAVYRFEPNSQPAFLELIDVLIYWQYIEKFIDHNIDLSSPQNLDLGEASLDTSLDNLNEIVEELNSSLPQQRMDQFLEVWATVYFQNLDSSIKTDGVHLQKLIQWKAMYNGLNRPAEYYQPYDLQRRPLDEEQTYKKFVHVEACLRAIRRYAAQVLGKKVPLDSWMHQPFKDIILDFSNPEAYSLLLRKLSQPVVQEYALLAEMALRKESATCDKQSASDDASQTVLDRLLRVGGGVPISVEN